MKNNSKFLWSIIAAAIIILSGCKTNNEVMSNSLIQKRKYTNGFYVERSAKGSKEATTKAMVAEENNIVNFPGDLDNEKLVATESNIEHTSGNNKSELTTKEKVKDLFSDNTKDLKTFRKKHADISKDIQKKVNSTLLYAGTASPNNIDEVAGDGGGMSIASFICSIAGLFVAGIILGILAIIFGAIGIGNGVYKGLAIAGVIIGIVDVIGALIIISTL